MLQVCFNFKCITENTVKFQYQGHDVFDIFDPLLTECTEFLYGTVIDIGLLNKRF